MEPGVFSTKYVKKMYFNTPKNTPLIINKKIMYHIKTF